MLKFSANSPEDNTRSLLRLALITSTLLFAMHAQAADGLVTVKSSTDVKATADKLESVMKAKGTKVTARGNH